MCFVILNTIRDWLGCKNIDYYLVLDDDSIIENSIDIYDDICSNLIKTTWEFGLEKKHVQLAIEHYQNWLKNKK